MNWMMLVRSKTFWAGLGSIVTGAGGIITGEMSTVDSVQLIFLGLFAIFGRDALNKK